MQTDNSSAYLPPVNSPAPPEAAGNTWRGVGSGLFNQNAVSKEDFTRQLQLAEYNNKYNEYLSSTQYQRAVADMKKAGLNPLLAYSQGGSPSSATSGNSPAGSGSGSGSGDNMLLKLMAGLVSKAIDVGLATQMNKSGAIGGLSSAAYIAKNPESAKQAANFTTGGKTPTKTVTRYYN